MSDYWPPKPGDLWSRKFDGTHYFISATLGPKLRWTSGVGATYEYAPDEMRPTDFELVYREGVTCLSSGRFRPPELALMLTDASNKFRNAAERDFRAGNFAGGYRYLVMSAESRIDALMASLYRRV